MLCDTWPVLGAIYFALFVPFVVKGPGIPSASSVPSVASREQFSIGHPRQSAALADHGASLFPGAPAFLHVSPCFCRSYAAATGLGNVEKPVYNASMEAYNALMQACNASRQVCNSMMEADKGIMQGRNASMQARISAMRASSPTMEAHITKLRAISG